MKTKKPIFYLLAVLMGGCVPVFSLHPLYTKETVVFKQDLLGRWGDPNSPENVWEFKRDDESENAYKLIVEGGDGAKGLFEARLVKLKDRLFLDVYPAKQGFEETFQAVEQTAKDPNKAVWTFNMFCVVPVHTFLKIDSIEPMLTMSLTDDDLMKELLKQDPNAVKCAVLEEDRYVLTASTKELQAFVLKYADGGKLFEKPIALNRAKAEGSQKSEDKKSGGSTDK